MAAMTMATAAEHHVGAQVFEKRLAPVKGTAAGDQRTIVFGINARGRNAMTQVQPCHLSPFEQ